MAVATRCDIDRQRRIDSRFPANQGLVRVRMAAVLDAQEALAAGELDAPYVLRQSLVDLSAAAEALAGELPAPNSLRG